MKKRKIFLGLALAAAAVFSLSACDEDNKDNDVVNTDEGQTTQYTIKFMNGSTEVDNKKVNKDANITAPTTNPTKAEDNTATYTFKGWFTAATGGTQLTATTKATADTTYYAQFTATPKQYTITFMNGTTEFGTKTLNYDAVITAPNGTPEKDPDNENNYVFTGWFTAATGGTELTATTKVTGAATYYAQFTATPREYNVIFMNGSVAFDTQTLSYNDDIVAPATNPTKAEDDSATYEFDGWYTEATGGTKVTDFGKATTTPTTFYAHYITHEKKTITFMDGADLVDEFTLAEGAQIVPPTDPEDYEDEIATYTFEGWKDEDGVLVTDFGTVTDDATFYASYTKNVKQYDIKFYNGDTELTTLAAKIDADTTITKPVASNLPTQTGKRFDFWTTNTSTNIPYDFSTKISGAVTLYAVFADETEYDTLIQSQNLLTNSDFYDQTVETGGAFDASTVTYKTNSTDSSVNSKGQYYLQNNSFLVDLGDKKITETGIVTIYAEVTLEGLAGEAFMQIDGSSGTKTNAEVFGIRAHSGKLAYRLDGGTDVDSTISLATNKAYAIKVVIDTAEGVANVYVDGQAVFTNIDVVITKINGVKFTAKPDGSTKKIVDNVAITFEAKTADPFVTAKTANLTAANNYLASDDFSGLAAKLQLYVQDYVNGFIDRVNAETELTGQNNLATEFASFLAGKKTQILVKAYTAANTPLDDAADQYVMILENITTAQEAQDQLDAVRFKSCTLDGIYTDKELTSEVEASSLTADVTELYAKVTVKQVEYETVNYSLNAEGLDAGTINKKIGQFTIQGEVRGRTKQWINPEDTTETISWTKSFKNGPIIVNAPGNGTLTLYAQNGSSSAATKIMNITELAADGTKTVRQYTLAGTQAVAPYGNGSPVMRFIIDVVEGSTYTIERGDGGTIDWYQFDMTCQVEKSEVNGFAIVDSGNVDFLVGESFDSSKLSLEKTYENGKTDELALTDVTIDSSAFDNTKSGTYEIKVTYGEFGSKTYTVNVWDIDSLKLGFDATYKGSQTSAGNTPYVNGKVKTIYSLNDTLNTNYLSLIAVAQCGSETKEFLLNNRVSKTGITIGQVDTTTAGLKTVEVSFTTNNKTISAEYNVTVVDAEPVKDADGNYIVNVDANYTGVAGAADQTLGNRFATIYDALQFLGGSNIETATRKILTIEAGTYNEKLEITVPYLTIIGDGQDTTLIEWDSLYGCPDASGYLQVTDSTQTVAIRESAIGCNISNLTISNWWNSEERFNSVDSIEYLRKNGLYTDKVNEHRALALLVMSDKLIMDNVALLGYQDTVEFFKGRQLLNNCYIAGTTDYIFGTNNTTFFNECEIHTIYNGSSSGGYTTAFKGASSGSSDWVQYGAIFYKCNFTADDKVGKGDSANTALGRPWGAYAAVAFIECKMGSHISKKAYDGASQNERYVSMSSQTPTTETVKFVEYGNTGDGAISATQAGMTYLDATTAANYHDYEVIFGTVNGKVSYSDAWNPEDATIVVDKTVYYFFNTNTNPTGTVYNMDPTVSLNSTSSPYVLGDLTFDATNGNIAYNSNSSCVNMKSGAKITFTVEEDTLVTIKAYSSSYAKFLVNGVGTTTDTLIQYYTAGTAVELVSTGDTYINNIQMKPVDSYDAATLSSIVVENAPANEFAVGDVFDETTIKVKALYSDSSYKYVSATFDTTAIDNTKAGTYTVTVTYNDKTTTFDVVYVGAVSTSFDKNAKIDFSSSTALAATLQNKKITYAEGFTYNDNSDSIQLNTATSYFSFDVEAGAVVTVHGFGSGYGYLLINGVSNNDQDVTIVANKAQTITISAENSANTGNAYNKSYLKSIDIVYPVIIDEDTVISFGSAGNYTNAGLEITGKTNDNENNTQIQGSIKFTVDDGATVKIYGYGGAAGTTNGDYTSYTVTANGETSTTQTGDYEVTVTEQGDVVITATDANNYLIKIEVTFA